MNCPSCGEIRYSKHWKPSQWAAWRAEVNDFNCCKVCSIECILAVPPEYQRDELRECATLYTIWCCCIQNGWLVQLRRFFEYWVAAEHLWRKEASYYGALKRTKATDPQGLLNNRWRRSEKNIIKYNPDDYFDPGNAHYKWCFEALLGETPGWNAETIGDIIESLLGLQFLVRGQGLKLRYLPGAFASFLHDWCLFVYRYHQATAWSMEYGEVFARIKAESNHVQIQVVLDVD